MKIVIVSSFFPPAWEWGGKAKSAWTLAQALAGQGVRVVVLATDARPVGRVDVPAVRTETGVIVRTAPVLGGGKSRFASRQGIAPGLLRLLADEMADCDLVHLQGIWGFSTPGVCRICTRHGAPYIISTRNEIGIWSLHRKRLKKLLYLHLIIKRNMQRAARIHFTSRQEREEAPRWLDRDRTFVLPNPVTTVFDGEGGRFRKQHGLPEDEVVAGLVGRLHKEKGFDVILPAIAGLDPGAKFRLVVIGPDEAGYLAEIDRMIRTLGISARVSLAGPLYKQDLADAYAGLDLLVVPSYVESFGNVVVEAVAQGTPAFVSEKVGLADWVAERKVGRVLPLESRSWTAALTRLDRVGIGREWAPEELKQAARHCFSASTIAQAMMDRYSEVIGQAGSRRGNRPGFRP